MQGGPHLDSSLRKWALIATAVVATVWHIAQPHRWGEVSYLAVTIGAALVAWVAAFAADRPSRRAAGLIAAGISASALGDASYSWWVAVHHAEPDTSIADVWWLGCYLFLGLGLLALLRARRGPDRRDVDSLIDMAVVGVVGFLVVWHFWAGPTLATAGTPLGTRLVWTAYPICDSTLLMLVVRVFTDRSVDRRLLRAIGSGVALWLVADTLYLALGTDTSLSRYLDGAWMLGAMLLAVGCWQTARPWEPTGSDVDEDRALRVGRWRLALGVAPLVVPSVIELHSFISGHDVNPAPLLAASVALIVLVYVRTVRLLDAGRAIREREASRERLYRALAANSSDAVLVLDRNGIVTNESPTTATFLGLGDGSTVGLDALTYATRRTALGRALFDRAVASPREVIEEEFSARRADGEELWLAARAINLLDDPDVRGVIINIHDITARHQAQEQLAHQAFHDQLTGIANRALFHDRVQHALERRSRTALDPAVLFLDLDGFKMVNDSLGHDAGDDLLRTVAARLVRVVRTGDTVARLGGDEFAVLIEQSSTPAEEAAGVSDRILEALSEPVDLDGRTVMVSASVGIAVADVDSTPATLLRDADIAMYQSKTNGKNRATAYRAEMREVAVRRLQLENDLHHALARGELHVVYQPVVELDTQRLDGFEALCRWTHPTLGDIRPDEFIPIAEATGLILPIGRWVLDTACQDVARWQHQISRHSALSIAVNVSGRQLMSETLLHDVRTALDRSGLDPRCLVLEVTESMLVDDPDAAAARLDELRRLGVRLAIDDFGTGYSSLAYLRQFPVDILKIDQSFVRTIDEPGRLPPIIRGLLDLSRTLQLETVAEGIESAAQLEQLRVQHCQLGQGYLFAKPLSPEDAERWLRDPAMRLVG